MEPRRMQCCSRFDVIGPAWVTLAPTCDLGVPDVTARTQVVRARRAPYCFLVRHWTFSGIPTAVIASLNLCDD